MFVSATSPKTGWFVANERLVDRADLSRLLDQLSTIDQGYVEVRLVDDYFPLLTAGFRKGLAVVACMWSQESMALLVGDSTVPALEAVDVLIMDDLGTYTGDYVMESARARDVLLRFADGADLRSLGEWDPL